MRSLKATEFREATGPRLRDYASRERLSPQPRARSFAGLGSTAFTQEVDTPRALLIKCEHCLDVT